MKMCWIQIEKEIVLLFVDEKDGKVIPGKLSVLPVGVFNKLYPKEQR